MEIILHCSASSFGNAVLIDSWHRQRGWTGIGYHAVILNGQITARCFNKFFDGTIETGRPFDDDNLIDAWETGAHTLGKNKCLGICLIGESGKFTQNQYAALYQFLTRMQILFKKIDKISQHSDHDAKKPYCAGIGKEYMNVLNEIFCK